MKSCYFYSTRQRGPKVYLYSKDVNDNHLNHVCFSAQQVSEKQYIAYIL